LSHRGEGGAGLPYLCRVRWPPVCRHGAFVSSIIVAGYGLLLMSWFSQIRGERRRGRAVKRFQKSSSPLSLHLQGRRSCTVSFKTAPFSFFFEEKEKNLGVTQKWVMIVAPLFTMLTEQRLCVVSL
jgi:hypothetical protein